MRCPHRVRDLLVYSSIITKAALDFEGTPWLSYDAHFRTLAAMMQLQTWGQVDQSLWSQHFSQATLRQSNRAALSISPYSSQKSEPSKSAKGIHGEGSQTIWQRARPVSPLPSSTADLLEVEQGRVLQYPV